MPTPQGRGMAPRRISATPDISAASMPRRRKPRAIRAQPAHRTLARALESSDSSDAEPRNASGQRRAGQRRTGRTLPDPRPEARSDSDADQQTDATPGVGTDVSVSTDTQTEALACMST